MAQDSLLYFQQPPYAYPLMPEHRCSPYFLTLPDVLGVEYLELKTDWITSFTETAPEGLNFNHPTISVEGADFCNITISYTHPGQGDVVSVEAWLPRQWNNRLKAVGGGGWTAGRFILSYYELVGAIGEGFATVTTDAGITGENPVSASGWGLVSPGNVNLYILQNLASVSLNDEAQIAKGLIESFYGKRPDYSYFSGCSQGGRQGMMLAQRYPEAYDGIAASAPGINWSQFIMTNLYPQMIMSSEGIYPHGCELDRIAELAVDACDELDGVKDGIIFDPGTCLFNTYNTVGEEFFCAEKGEYMAISESAARISNVTYTGPRSSKGHHLWHGPNIGSKLADPLYGPAATKILENGTISGSVSPLSMAWVNIFIRRQAEVDIGNFDQDTFDKMFHAGIQQYDSIIGTSDADLSQFKAAGGKLLGYHGMFDEIIPVGGTEQYYDAVARNDVEVHDFYRMFEVPAFGHCAAGEKGGQPTSIFDALRAWVENGTAPDTIQVAFNGDDGQTDHRILCPYPSKARYDGIGDPTLAESFYCS